MNQMTRFLAICCEFIGVKLSGVDGKLTAICQRLMHGACFVCVNDAKSVGSW